MRYYSREVCWASRRVGKERGCYLGGGAEPVLGEKEAGLLVKAVGDWCEGREGEGGFSG